MKDNEVVDLLRSDFNLNDDLAIESIEDLELDALDLKLETVDKQNIYPLKESATSDFSR